MDNLEIIARQAAKIIDLEDKLESSKSSSDHWYNEYQKLQVIPAGQEATNAKQP